MIRREGLRVNCRCALAPSGVRLEQQFLQHLIDFLWRVAADNGIASGLKRLLGSLCQCTAPGPLHRQIVRENEAWKVKRIAKQPLENALGEGCWNFVVSRIQDVRRHYGRQTDAHPCIRFRISVFNA